MLAPCTSRASSKTSTLQLERYTRHRDHIAGIVVFDGESNEAAQTPSEADPCLQAIDVNQPTIFPDEFDQRQPEQWQEQQWDPTNQQSQDTPLAQWATEANTLDGIDPIPPEEEPVFFTD